MVSKTTVGGDGTSWEWDATLFEGSAAYYDRGRLPYAPDFGERFAQATGLGPSSRVLDVGCGPGSVALLVAEYCGEVVGIDPDAGMIEEARRIASERGVHSSRWVHDRAEALPLDLGRFDVAVFASSFHWMDRPLVAAAVRDMLEPDGVLVHVERWDQPHLRRDAPRERLPSVPHDEVRELRIRFLGPDRRAGQSIRNSSPSDEDAVFTAAGFHGPELVGIPDGRDLVRSIDDVVAEVFSTSSTAPHLFGDRLAEFESELRRILESHGDKGRFGAHLPGNLLKIWRPDPRPE